MPEETSTSRAESATTETTSQPAKLSYDEVKALCHLIADEFITIEGTPALNALMILAGEITTQCKEYVHTEFIGLSLQYALFTVSGDADAPMRAAVESYREQMKRGELRRGKA